MGKKIIEKIMQEGYIKDKPPVLIDVGASGSVHKIWKPIAKYSICIAFEPDTRDLLLTKKIGKEFMEFYLINRVVSDVSGKVRFYLTNSPHCSSVLEPDIDNLSKYEIVSLFKIKETLNIEAITINDVMKMLNLDYIDWFKCDSQGTDLKIFRSINESILNKIICAEFEPGIMDAYKGEDKLYQIMKYFDEKKHFFCDDIIIKGMARITESEKLNLFNSIERRFFNVFLKKTAFWAEISYFNEMKDEKFTKRDYLLAIVFAILKKQYGFVLELCNVAIERFGEDNLLRSVKIFVLKKMKRNGHIKLLPYIIKRIFEKVAAHV